MLTFEQLIGAALKVRERSYSPYSKFAVGAALAVSGWDQPIVGCNVENASYGLSICAERMAIGSAVSQGLLLPGNAGNQHKLLSVVVVASPLATPCGACRQFLSEFNLDAEIVCVDAENLADRRTWKLSDLLPESFQL